MEAEGAVVRTELPADAAALEIVAAAARAGLVDPRADLLASAVAVEALACESAAAAIALALHTGMTAGLAGGETFAPLVRGEVVGALALSSDEVPTADGAHSRARVVGGAADARAGSRSSACEAARPWPPRPCRSTRQAITQEPVGPPGCSGLVCGHVRFDANAVHVGGATQPFMSRVRVLLAAAGLGMGRRALHEALISREGIAISAPAANRPSRGCWPMPPPSWTPRGC